MTTNIIHLFAVASLFLFATACNTTTDTTERLSISPSLFQCWTHSYEEDASESLQLYRVCESMDFPPARFRQVYQFVENGDCLFLQIGANDVHTQAQGKWEYDSGEQLLTIKKEDETIIEEFKIDELIENKLVLRIL